MTILCLCLEPPIPLEQDATQPHCTRSADAAGFALGSEGKASAKSKKKGFQQGMWADRCREEGDCLFKSVRINCIRSWF